jgi:hypothetical protein
MPLNSKWRWIGYILVGVCLVVAIWLFSMAFPKWHATPLESNLFEASLATVVLLGYVLKSGWQYRRIAKFWLAFSAFASVHCVVFIFLSFHVERWSAFVLGPIVGVETPVMAAFIFWAIDEQRG